MATTVTLKPNAIDISGSTSGTTTLQATAVAGTTTLTLPAATDTLVGKATTDTLTNKTLTGAVMNGTLGATTPSTVAATSISASTTLGVTGVATFSAGTAALPAITTTGDTNTGIFFPAADTIAFAEGGAEVARFDSSGNFGIGTAGAPLSRLDVAVEGTLTRRFLVNFDDSVITVKGASNTAAPEALRFIGDNIRFNTGTSGSGTEAARIDSNSNLLVGRTSVGTATSGSTIRFGASGQGIATTVYGFPITNTSYKDIAITTGGSDWNCLLLVSVSNGSNGNVATRTTYVVLGRGTTATFTSLATQNGSSGGASFTATCPSNGVMRITNTSGSDVEITATVFGHGG